MITIEINGVDVTSQIAQTSLRVVQQITNLVDTASFNVRKAGGKTLTPAYGDEVEIYDGSTKIFGGTVLSVNESPVAGPEGVFFMVSCVDWTYTMDKVLVSKTYTDTTIADIIADIIDSYAPTFTYTNVSSTFLIEKIVFNQVPISVCLGRLASIVNFDWYVDEDKDVHFFSKYTNIAPFDLTDTNGNYVRQSLMRISDGSQVANRIKVRGGEYNGELYSDSITVSGNDSKSFKLPYRFANLVVTLDTGGGPVSQDVGIDFIDDFTTDDLLYNFQEQMIRFENNLSDGDIINFEGNPKIPVFAVAEDPVSIAEYGRIEKLIRDDSIESNTVARKRANAELYTYSEPIIDATFRTYTAGLRAGMVLNIESDIHGFDDELIVKTLTFSMRDHNNFEYQVNLVSTKRYDFITLLAKILEPDPRPGDEQETSEEIFTDTQIITVQEEYENVTAVEDISQQVEVQEEYEINPFGDDTNAIYVLGPYTPDYSFQGTLYEAGVLPEDDGWSGGSHTYSEISIVDNKLYFSNDGSNAETVGWTSPDGGNIDFDEGITVTIKCSSDITSGGYMRIYMWDPTSYVYFSIYNGSVWVVGGSGENISNAIIDLSQEHIYTIKVRRGAFNGEDVEFWIDGVLQGRCKTTSSSATSAIGLYIQNTITGYNETIIDYIHINYSDRKRPGRLDTSLVAY